MSRTGYDAKYDANLGAYIEEPEVSSPAASDLRERRSSTEVAIEGWTPLERGSPHRRLITLAELVSIIEKDRAAIRAEAQSAPTWDDGYEAAVALLTNPPGLMIGRVARRYVNEQDALGYTDTEIQTIKDEARREGEAAMRERAAKLGDYKAAEHARSLFSQYSDEATKSGHNWAKIEAEYLAASIRALPLSDGTIRKEHD